MCGLMGWDYNTSDISSEQKAMIAAILAIGNDSRGGDSWGFYDFKNMIKGIGDLANHAKMLLGSERLIGHTRKATTGSICTENSHPFDIGDIIGAHNGIITNHSELKQKYSRDFQVDSMHIFANLNENLDLKDLSGYGSIVWTRKSDPSRVYLCRMSGGELSIRGIGGSVDTAQGIIWSSDEDHLELAVKSAGIQTFEFEVDVGQVYYTENGKLYKDDMKLELAGRYTTSMPDWRAGWNDAEEWESSYSTNYVKPTPPVTASRFLTAQEVHEKDVEKLQAAWDEFMGESEIELLLENDDDDLEYVKGLGWLRTNEDGTSTVIKQDK